MQSVRGVWSVLLFGCTSPMVTPDAQTGDASPDVNTVEHFVTVQIGGDVPAVGVTVFFQRADSSLAAVRFTDALGVAKASVDSDSFVTVVDPFGPSNGVHDVRTFAGVANDDRLVIRRANEAQATQTSIDVRARLDSDPYGYQVLAGCSTVLGPTVVSGNEITTRALLVGCASLVDLLLVHVDSADNNALSSFVYTPDVAVSPYALIDLTSHAYVPASPHSITVTDMPFDGVISDSVVAPRGELFQKSAAVAAGPITTKQNMMAMPLATSNDVYLEYASQKSEHALYDRVPWSSTFAVSGTRFVKDVAACPMYDVATRQVVWSELTNGADPDFSLAWIEATRGLLKWTWTIIGPHGQASLQLPELPIEIAELNIAPGDQSAVKLLVRGSTNGGYADIREGRLSPYHAIHSWLPEVSPSASARTGTASSSCAN